MISLKKVILATLLFLATVAPANATYPSLDIAHWDLSVSNDRNDPDYQKVRELVSQKQFDEALAILDGKITNQPKEATPEILKAVILNEKDTITLRNEPAPRACIRIHRERRIHSGIERPLWVHKPS